MDDDASDAGGDAIDFSTSPVQNVLSSFDVHDNLWQNDDLADPPRLRLESGMNTPLLLNGSPRRPAGLNGLNYLNIVTYFFNCCYCKLFI